MTKAEMIKKINGIVEVFEEDGITTKRFGEGTWEGCLGVRFENKVREIGEVITDKSRSNFDREDERDFPEYGTPKCIGMCARDYERRG